MAFEPREPQKELKYDELRIYTDEELNNYTEEELKNFKIKHDIPDVEELEKGPWPSFVADAKREALHRQNSGNFNFRSTTVKRIGSMVVSWVCSGTAEV